MCGIVGIINGNRQIKYKLRHVFSELLFVDQLRGTDGAGVLLYNDKKNTYDVIKDADFTEVFSDKSLDRALKDSEDYPYIIGHNRAATRGKVSSENNHPFDEGNVVLVHNGTMSYVPKQFTDGTTVDSHSIAKMINEDSVENFIKDSFGAYALVWFNKQTKDLNLLRNKDRPLYLVYSDTFAVVSSEAKMAEWILTRNEFQVKNVEPVSEHTLYTFKPYNLEPTKTDLTHIRSFVPATPTYDRDAYRQYWQDALDDEDDYGAMGVHYPPYNNVGTNIVPLSPTHARAASKDTYKQINPWTYFDTVHKIPAPPVSSPSDETKIIVIDPTKPEFRLKQKIYFSVDKVEDKGRFRKLIGNIHGVPIKDFVVMCNTPIDEDSLITTTNFMVGTISSIQTKKNEPTCIWVREVYISGMPDPQYAVDMKETNEKK